MLLPPALLFAGPSSASRGEDTLCNFPNYCSAITSEGRSPRKCLHKTILVSECNIRSQAVRSPLDGNRTRCETISLT